jgi:DHA1 family inner membrane transport protein
MLFGVGGVAANAMIGRIGDKLSVETLIRTSLLGLAAVFLALLEASEQFVAALTLLGLWSLVATLFMVPQQKRLISLAPGQRGLLLAVNASALYLGMSLGTLVGSATNEIFGLSMLPLASFSLVVLAAISHALSVIAVRRAASQGQTNHVAAVRT